MKKILLLLCAAFIGTTTLLSQVTSISVEPYYTDDGLIIGYPAGHTTYRIYAHLSHTNDRLTAVYGDDDSPLFIRVSESGIWNHEEGAATAYELHCSQEDAAPAVLYDSFLAIGYACNGGSSNEITALDDPAAAWISQGFNTSPYGLSNIVAGTDVGSIWSGLPTDINTQAGSEKKVLVAQITTNGQICGTFNFQVFPEYEGVGSEYIEQAGISFSTWSSGNLSISVDVNPPTCHDDQDASVEISASGGVGAYTYSIDGSNFDSSSVIEFLMGDDYNVFVKDAMGCISFLPITIDNPEEIEASFEEEIVMCHGADDGQIIVSVSGGVAPYEFDYGNGYSSENPITNVAPGMYILFVKDANGCIYDLPELVLIAEPEAITVTGLEAININGNTPGGNTSYTVSGGVYPYEFQWTNENGDIVSVSEDLPQLYGQIGSGVYTLTITDEAGCTLIIELNISYIAGMDELSSDLSFRVFPNPVTDILNIELQSHAGTAMGYRISDSAGRVLHTFEFTMETSLLSKQVDMASFAPGIYFIEIHSGNYLKAIRVIKI